MSKTAWLGHLLSPDWLVILRLDNWTGFSALTIHIADTNLEATRAADVAALSALIRLLPRGERWMRASENSAHLGAILVDASIQPGINYTTVVQPRVKRILRDFPSAATLSGLRELLRTRSVGDLLSINNARKCSVFESLVNLLQAEGVDSSDDLRRWIVQNDSRGKLLAITGIGIKTAAYLRLLVGLPAIAVDVHLRRLAADVGVKRSDEELEVLYVRAAEALGMSSYDVDGLLWQNGSRRARQSTTSLHR